VLCLTFSYLKHGHMGQANKNDLTQNKI
jgi:hypothetical protein